MRSNKAYNGLGGFSSHASSMISSLKTNFRRKDLDLLKGSKTKVTYGKFNDTKNATPHQLKRIKEKLQEENKKILKRNVIILVVAICILIYVIGFVKF